MLKEDTEVNSKGKEEPVEQKQEQDILTIGKEEPASVHLEVLSDVKEEPTVQSTVNEVNKDQSNVKESTDKKYKKQKSLEKKKKESKKEKPSETNKKDIQEVIQENPTEEFRNSGPQEMNEQSAKKNNLKEKRKLIDKKCYELMKSTEKNIQKMEIKNRILFIDEIC